jgi:hypothetical protein
MAIFNEIQAYDKSMISITIFYESCTYDKGNHILPFLTKPTLMIEAFLVCHFL